jgi:SAM-dependent methyltransferase
LEKTYGGTTPMEIAKGTEKLIEKALQLQPPHVQLAIQLYRQKRGIMLKMSFSDVGGYNGGDGDGAREQIQAQLDSLLQEHNLTERDLHNILQQATWDASAYAKAARALTQEMPIDIQRKVQKGCDLLMEHASKAVVLVDYSSSSDDTANNTNEDTGSDMTCPTTILDVGCGFGVLVPFLKKAGLKAGLKSSQIHGIDLSPEMIRHAKDTMSYYQNENDAAGCDARGLSFSPVLFTAGDFFSFRPPSHRYYHGLIFCSSLHDMPNMMYDTLPKARELLTPTGGVLVIVHPQGASHVLQQVKSNPTMVPRGLPTKSELQTLEGWELIHPPAIAGSMQEAKEGYLAVLVRR